MNIYDIAKKANVSPATVSRAEWKPERERKNEKKGTADHR